MRWNRQLSVFLLLVVFSGASPASTPQDLKYDPFSYLESQSKVSNRKSTKKAPVVAKVNWRRELRATIVAGNKSVANIDGKIVRLGEKIDGYKLVAVEKKTAVFEKNEKRVVLKMTTKRKKK